ncbi:hypothetical protein MRS44_017399 [Fusarium solani]|uniref:uncharacterized protein n=1 Tax=Fusarium solani TaxID=169388 RepID=UPI0032C434D2|nr:hypothetical protein MRS44_017399 [Fusarium solani]
MPKTPNHDEAIPRVIRPLGDNEGYQSALHQLRMYCSNIVTCRYVIPDTVSSLSSELEVLFEGAIAKAVLSHPALQVGLVGEASKKPVWVELHTINLRRHVEWHDADLSGDYGALYGKVLQAQLDTRFPNLDTQPGWRVAILKHRSERCMDVMFTWNHANADGMSGRIFHEDLLHNLNSTHSHDQSPAVEDYQFETTATAETFPPPQEEVAKFPITLKYTAVMMWKEFMPLKAHQARAHATWAPIRTLPYRTHLHTISIGNDILQLVLSACRKHGTTLTGLVHALTVVSLAHRLPEKDAAAFTGLTPISTRPFLPCSPEGYPWLVPNRTVANYVSQTSHEFNASLVASVRRAARSWPDWGSDLMDLIWSTAAQVRREIKQELDSGMEDIIVGLMRLVRDWRAHQKQQVKKPRTAGWLVTNLGVIDGGHELTDAAGHEMDWRIDRAEFQLSAEVPGAFFHICPVAVKGRELTIDISWQDGIVDASLGERLASDIQSIVTHVASL